ncbi:DEAD/DEAH box helicase [Egicoccus sp. AB-alg2]|uniref:DEAD/DEAH box helicase n=1 Tax=Egicoccus sp. AB-alg2 TaxID=3242693 RepID=UPI00359CE526
MRRSLRLRRWQKEALDRFEKTTRRDFLAVATPGAGKTTFALTAGVRDLAGHPHRRLVVVAPTQHLKHQWAEAASNFGVHLEPEWASSDPFPHDMHGVVVTYQQVAAQPRPLRGPSDDAFVILDEIHHAGTERAWGDGVFEAFELAARRLSLSGTPFRSDQNPIPFVDYDFEEAVADYVYGYGEALKDGGVVRPVFFPRINGHMEWSTPDGTIVSATFDDRLDRTLASQRLRTALSPDGEWLPTVLEQAHTQLLRLRETHPDAGGLVIAMDVDHARAIQKLLKAKQGVEAVVATSDDPQASERIAEFAASRDPWIVAVRMVSEGVDVPRLRVGVYATNTVTELFFRQAVGRLVRWSGNLRRQKAFMFIPDDFRLRTFAAQIADQRTHSLKRREDEGDQDPVELLDQLPPDGEDQLSLFAAISATAVVDHDPSSIFDDHHPEDLVHDPAHEDLALEIELAPPPPRVGDHGSADGTTLTVSRTQRKRELRQANTDRVRMLTHLTGLAPEVVNGQLNREAGIRSINQATIRDLERRLRAADRWIDRA